MWSLKVRFENHQKTKMNMFGCVLPTLETTHKVTDEIFILALTDCSVLITQQDFNLLCSDCKLKTKAWTIITFERLNHTNIYVLTNIVHLLTVFHIHFKSECYTFKSGSLLFYNNIINIV